MPARYRALFSQWRNGTALDTYGNTGGWITGINSGLSVSTRGYQQATTPTPALQTRRISPAWIPIELSRVESQYASVELADGANVTAMATIGAIRDNAPTSRNADRQSRTRFAFGRRRISIPKSRC